MSNGEAQPEAPQRSNTTVEKTSKAEDNGSKAGSMFKSPQESRSSRVNKLYRCPPTPERDEMFVREKSFIIDSVAVSRMQDDFFHTNPKVGAVIFPYNSQQDKHCRGYFYETEMQNRRPYPTKNFQPNIQKVLKKTGQDVGGSAIQGVVPEKFYRSGYLNRYFRNRNQNGIGHSMENINGHQLSMQDVQPVMGYNGQFGFRRNTPDLRHSPSPFGISSRLPLH